MGRFNDINEALKKAVLDGAFVASSQIVFENNKDQSDKSQPWLSVFNLPAPVSQASLGGSGLGTDAHAGIMQIDVNYPDHYGMSDILTKCDEINAHFGSGSFFQKNNACVRIGNVSVERVQNSQGSATVPISIEYFLQTARV